MKTAKISNHKEYQFVWLPEEFHMEDTEVFVKRIGNAVVLLPKSNAWDSLIDSLPLFSEDFMQTGDR